MHVVQRAQQSAQQLQQGCLGEEAVLLMHGAGNMSQITLRQVGHHVISRTILLKGIHQANNVRVIQHGKLHGLAVEITHTFPITLFFPLHGDNATSGFIAVRKPCREVLFDNVTLTTRVIRQISDTEPTLR